jgi:2-phospho-L-lactate/phosphoenolpyruvate guanylyltransferase
MANMHILIPCKPLAEGKSRLSVLLSAQKRFELCAALLERTIDLARQVVSADCIWLTTSDATAQAIARKQGVAVIADHCASLNGALTASREQMSSNSMSVMHRIIVLPIDLPLADAEALARAADESADVVIACDRAKKGTNLLLLKGSALFRFHFSFGDGSFSRHCDHARHEQLSLAVIDDPALAFDLDEPDDLLRSGLYRSPEWAESVS